MFHQIWLWDISFFELSDFDWNIFTLNKKKPQKLPSPVLVFKNGQNQIRNKEIRKPKKIGNPNYKATRDFKFVGYWPTLRVMAERWPFLAMLIEKICTFITFQSFDQIYPLKITFIKIKAHSWNQQKKLFWVHNEKNGHLLVGQNIRNFKISPIFYRFDL
jgi:hypothetical protein